MEKELSASINASIEDAVEKLKAYYMDPKNAYTEKMPKSRRIMKILQNIQNDITELSK